MKLMYEIEGALLIAMLILIGLGALFAALVFAVVWLL